MQANLHVPTHQRRVTLAALRASQRLTAHAASNAAALPFCIASHDIFSKQEIQNTP